jgi:hypothetical protein
MRLIDIEDDIIIVSIPTSSSLSSCHHSTLPDIDLSNSLPSRTIFGYSHPAPASHSAQNVTPPDLRASYTTCFETRSPLQNSFTPTIVGFTADMASPLPLQRTDTMCCVGDFSSLLNPLDSDSIPQRIRTCLLI